MNEETTNAGAAPTRELSFGEKAVGITFNPGGMESVNKCKCIFAELIDQMHDLRNEEGCTSGMARHASTAITMLEDAQMRAVKALTWKE